MVTMSVELRLTAMPFRASITVTAVVESRPERGQGQGQEERERETEVIEVRRGSGRSVVIHYLLR
jgi:hypothetical protein